MIRNDSDDFALRLYNRVPANYRAYDADLGFPLLAVLRVVGAQAAALRADLQALWDDFFIETCADWVIPYIGALLNVPPLDRPVAQSDRLNVWNAVAWRRSRGSAAMISDLVAGMSGLPADAVDFLQGAAVSEDVRAAWPRRVLTPDLRNRAGLAALDTAADRNAHATGITAGRQHQFHSVDVLIRPLRTFALTGVTPASAGPGDVSPADASAFTFDPLFREIPLFRQRDATPITRAQFAADPWETSGVDLCVRQFGIPLAAERPATPVTSSDLPLSWHMTAAGLVPELAGRWLPFAFGGEHTDLRLHPVDGMRLMDAHTFAGGGAHFIITALLEHDGREETLGSLSTLLAAHDLPDALRERRDGNALPEQARLVLRLELGGPRDGFGELPISPGGRFPGATIALRAARPGPARAADALYAYLPALLLDDRQPVDFWVSADGSTFWSVPFEASQLACASWGQVYPPRTVQPSTTPATDFVALSVSHGIVVPDTMEFASAGRQSAHVQIDALWLDDQESEHPLGSLLTTNVQPSWSAEAFNASGAVPGAPVPNGRLCLRIRPLDGLIPRSEVVVTRWDGRALLVYVPEVSGLDRGTPVDLLVADDGSTYLRSGALTRPLSRRSYGGLQLARAGAGQVLPIAQVVPLRQRTPISRDLVQRLPRPLQLGALAVDPEAGRFALPAGDPAVRHRDLSVDYVEAFGDRIGARSFLASPDAKAANRYVASRAGVSMAALSPPTANMPPPVHESLEQAVAAARDGDVIELLDSATYASRRPINVPPTFASLEIRAAAGTRPCLTFFGDDHRVTAASLETSSPGTTLSLTGLLIAGGPVHVRGSLNLSVCSLAPTAVSTTSLIADGGAPDSGPTVRIDRSICGALRIGPGVDQVHVSNSIVAHAEHTAIEGLAGASLPAPRLLLERVTVLGRVKCDVLEASDCLFEDVVDVDDRQSGYIRYSRFQVGSALPCRFRCVPPRNGAGGDLATPYFMSRRAGRPDFCQLAPDRNAALVSASEARAEVGAFAQALIPARMINLQAMLRQFLPAGMSSLVINQT